MKGLLPNPYLLGAGIALLCYMLIFGVKRLLSTKVARFTGEAGNRWDDHVAGTIEQTKHLFMFAAALYIGFHFVPHPKKYAIYANKAFFVMCMWQIAVWGNYLINKWIDRAISVRARRNPASTSSISLVQLFSKIALFSFIFLFTLSNLDVKITTMLAGLGVGGIAVALALQNILGDLFSSLSIVLDKPFMVGDFIIIDQFMGEVEKIGLKTTRIRSLSGEQIICSNSDLLSARIRNYKRMHERRIVFVLSLVYQNSPDALVKATEIISNIIKSKERVRFERCHFMKFAPYSLDIETVFWVLSDDYDLYMDIQQQIFLDIHRAFYNEGLLFALPTQKLNITPTEVLFKDFSRPSTERENQNSLS